MKCAASPGGTFEVIVCASSFPVNITELPHARRLELAESDIAGENGGSMCIRQTPTLALESRYIVV